MSNSPTLHRLLYQLGVGAYCGAIRLASPINSKAKAMVKGRKEVIETIKKERKDGEKWVMIHTSSVGEFEQARPIIEWLHENHPEYKICLTFFSSSGYEALKNHPLVDIVTYLPFDNSSTLPEFIDLLAPQFVLLIKYEFWLRMINLFHDRGIPILLVSAIFRTEQPFFKKRIGKLFRDALHNFDTIFIQNKESEVLLQSIGLENYILSGDTRMDRVVHIKEKEEGLPEFAALREKAIKQGKRIIIGGSTWDTDEKLLLELADKHSNLLLILVPHEIGLQHLQRIIQHSPKEVTLFSQWDKGLDALPQLLLIDQMGLLSKLYRYADIAYIGGGFGKGIHNTIEPSVYGIPVIFGPRYQKFREAKELIQTGGGFCIHSYSELKEIVEHLLSNPQSLMNSGKAAEKVVYDNLGATEVITSYLSSHYLK